MVFFRELEPKQKHPPNDFDIACAKKLKEALVKKGKSLRRSRLSAWADEFRILRKYEKETVIIAHLDWYCLNIGKQYIPEAESGKAFKEKFDKIKSARKRMGHFDIEDSTVKLTEKLKGFVWPTGFNTELETTIQKSLNGYREFRLLVTELEEQKIKNKWHARYVTYFASKLPKKAIVFVELYMLEVNKKLVTWKTNLPSSLVSFAFDPDNKMFAGIGRQWSREQYASIEMWDIFMSLID